MKRLIIIGSTSLAGNDTARQAVRQAIRRHFPDPSEIGPDDEVGSGGAEGVDTMAEEEWRAYAHKRAVVFLPKVKRWTDGFRPRNLQMAEWCTHCVRIADKRSKTYGSGWTRDRAREMGKPCEEIVIGT